MLDSYDVIAFVPAADLDRASVFYEQVLGLPLTERTEFASIFDAHGTMLRVTAVPKVAQPGYTVLGWSVPDITATVRGLSAKGVMFLRYDMMDQDEDGIWNSPGGMVAWFTDLDGNTLSLTQFPRPALALASDSAPGRHLGRGDLARQGRGPPLLWLDHARVDEVEPVEEAADRRLVSQCHLLDAHPGVQPPDHRCLLLSADVAGRVRHRQVAACWDGPHQARHDPVGVLGVGDQLHDDEQQDGNWLAEVQRRRRGVEDGSGVAQIRLQVVHDAVTAAGEHRAGVRQHHRVVVHVHDARVRGDGLGDLVRAAGRGQSGADVEELADPALAGQVPDHAGEKRPVRPHVVHDLRIRGDGVLGRLAVDGEVLHAAQPVVVDASGVRVLSVEPWNSTAMSGHEVILTAGGAMIPGYSRGLTLRLGSVTQARASSAANSCREIDMSLVRVHNFAVSLDGYGTGEGQTLEAPFGHAGERLLGWFFATRSFRAMHSEEGGSTGVDDAFANNWGTGIGAEIMGRNKFGPQRGPWTDHEWQGWWGDEPPFRTPVFVLTHHLRPSIEMKGGTTFHFIDASPASALEAAREAAGGLDVRIGGGPATVRQFLAADLIDYMHIVLVPIVLGRGERLWDGFEGLEERFAVESVTSPAGVTHLTFTRR
jgi:dihydrofolate reductase/predicted enzyme related to lactoylglutathione lyase